MKKLILLFLLVTVAESAFGKNAESANDGSVSTWMTIISFIFMIVICPIEYQKGKKSYRETGSQQVLTSVPGICTAWGICWTFISIVICLFLLVKNRNPEDFSIFNITASLIPAFLTSVVGMLFSIYYSQKINGILAKDESGDIQKSGNPMAYLASLNTAVNKLVSQNTTLQNIVGSLSASMYHLGNLDTAVSNIQKKMISQDTTLKDVLDAVSIDVFGAVKLNLSQLGNLNATMRSIDKQLTQNVAASLKLLGSLDVSVRNINTQQKSQNLVLQNFVTTFTKEFKKYFASAHTDFEQQMKDFTTKEVSKFSANLTTVGQQMKAATETVLLTQNKMVGDFDKNLQDVIAALQDRQMESIHTIGNQATETVSAFSESLKEGLQQTTNEMKENIVDVQKDISDNLNMSVKSICDSISSLSETVEQKLTVLSDEITKTSTDSLKTLKDEIEFVSDRIGQICNNYEQAQEAYKDALQNVHDSNENWESMIETNKTSIAQVMNTNEGLAKVVELMENRQDGIKSLQNEINGIAGTISQLQELNSVLTKTIKLIER